MGNADLTIIAQAPKLQAFIPEMQQSIAQQLDCSANQINVKATTTETLGFTGRKGYCLSSDSFIVLLSFIAKSYC